MNETEALEIAKEVMYVVRNARDAVPGIYDFVLGEMDIADEVFEMAYVELFGAWSV